MPKKKLTKAQVKRAMNLAARGTYDLILDKMGHVDSNVPMSLPKLLEVHKTFQNAAKRMK